ncbi:MAG: QcrA and Rieske domain-containing protein [Acidimicrobiia bacterium]
MGIPLHRRVTRREALSAAAIAMSAVCLGCQGDDGSDAATPPGAVPFRGFGGRVPAGSVDDLRREIAQNGLAYVAEARTYVMAYPEDRVAAAKAVLPVAVHAGLDAGLVGLYQKCPHLGCRIPYCSTASEFQCPCHESVFNRVGEYRSGPSPRGMDMFPIRVHGGRVTIDTRVVVRGPAQSADPSGLGPTGASCI